MIKILFLSLIAYFSIMYLMPLGFIIIHPLINYADFGKFFGLFMILIILLLLIYATRDKKTTEWVEEGI